MNGWQRATQGCTNSWLEKRYAGWNVAITLPSLFFFISFAKEFGRCEAMKNQCWSISQTPYKQLVSVHIQLINQQNPHTHVIF